MSRERFRRRGSHVSSSINSYQASNVIDIGSVRNRTAIRSRVHTVFYLNEGGRPNEFASLSDVHLVDIRDADTLTRKLLIRIPDVILVESSIQWTDALTTIRQLVDIMAAPVVLLVDGESQIQDPTLIKKAYAAGVCDTLFLPLDGDELRQTLSVLLHFQAKASY